MHNPTFTAPTEKPTIRADTAMQAVTLTKTATGERKLSVTTVPIPEPEGHEVLLRVMLAGICGTDLELLSGYKSLSSQILGHEFVGVVSRYGRDVPQSSQLARGTRVVSEINCVPAGSGSATAHERAQDPTRTAVGIFGRGGAFAQWVAVPAVNVHAVPANVPDETAVFAEPAAAACQILRQLALPREQPVAVLGAGRLGWTVAGVLAACGCEVVVLSRMRDAQRDRALAEGFGAELRAVADVKEDEFQVVVDCTGAPGGLETAMRIVRPRGTIVLKSTTAPGAGGKVDLTPIVVKEIVVLGSRCGPFPVALRLMERKVFDPSVLINARFELDDAEEGFKTAATKGVLKVLIAMPLPQD